VGTVDRGHDRFVACVRRDTRVALDMLAGTLRAGDALREKKPADRMEITATAFVLACACAIGVTPWIPFGAHWFALGRILEYLR